MADNFVDPFDMDMTEIFDDLHEFGEFPAAVRADANYATFNHELPTKVHIKSESIYPTPAPYHPPVDPGRVPVPRNNNSTNAELEQQKQLRRRAQIAASGRRGRAKRKREKLDLEARNKKLEEENRALQSTIAELQFEMQRANSEKQRSIYEMENEILKKQVTEHRSFVDQVQNLMRGPDTSKIERKRLIQQGSNSAVAQLLGLLYASHGDPSWKMLNRKSFGTEDFEFKCGKYQFLPFNTNAKTAKRFSLRADVLCKAKTKYVAKVLWDSCFDTGKDYDSFIASALLSEGKVDDVKDVKVALKEIDAFAKEQQSIGIMDGAEAAARLTSADVESNGAMEDILRESETTKIRKHVQVKKGKSGEESTVERLSVVTIRTGLRVQVPFFETDKKEDEEVIIVATIASDTLQNLTEKEEKVTRDGSTRITGYVFRNRANGECLVSILWSKPISKDGWVGFRPQDEVQIREDGTPSPRFEKVASMFMTSAAKQANRLERAVLERAAKVKTEENESEES